MSSTEAFANNLSNHIDTFSILAAQNDLARSMQGISRIEEYQLKCQLERVTDLGQHKACLGLAPSSTEHLVYSRK